MSSIIAKDVIFENLIMTCEGVEHLMINTPGITAIEWLFNAIWPLMEGSQGHLARMIGKQNSITRAFEEFGNDPSQLLRALDAMPDVGLVIASGLIFSANPDDFVPFDQYTMGWAISENIVPDNYISKGCNSGLRQGSFSKMPIWNSSRVGA